jgi:hypothetical protein
MIAGFYTNFEIRESTSGKPGNLATRAFVLFSALLLIGFRINSFWLVEIGAAAGLLVRRRTGRWHSTQTK